ncbi:serine/threonine protein kinase [Nocardia sp. 2]|uniref:non-specific serine/threonine protein kinase n=1 Tax=Nocardia acididurans TaxID=2802282 RepID=A0ABS1MB69_9NOCA|nr:serine/threonine-protein kinase [Nocardia acididurans]MBL1077893.1 serine/threonine protein kinase [Nocardia acididurans]
MIAGHYRLVERIGSGGTGVVWRAVDERLERSVAIKQILTQPSLSPADKDIVRQRAAREARNAARFQHPNAIVVFDITEHEGDPCLVMEYLPSQSLAVVLSAQGTLPLPQVARIGEQTASALIAAHRAGIVHRDVKPGNILLGDNGAVKITDFGIAKSKGDVTLTATGLISGTAAYLAPEVARGAEPSPAADVFALGATLFHALEGEPPYGTNPNPLALLYAAANGQISEPRNAGPLSDLLLGLLAFEPEDRPSMYDVRDAMAEFAEVGPDAEATRVMAHRRSNGPRTPQPVPQRPAPPPRPVTRQMERRPSQNADIPTGAMSAAMLETPPPQRPAGGPPTRSHAAVPDHYDDEPAPPKRKFIWIAVAAVVAVVAGVAIALSASNGSDDQGAQGGTTTSSSTGSTSTTKGNQSALGSTKSVGDADVLGAANMIDSDFYGQLVNLNFSAAWDRLTPAAQKVYGSEQAFADYWKNNRITGYSTIGGARGSGTTTNSDGSVDMMIGSVTTGSQSKSNIQLRVVNSAGGLLIDSDTQL